jgi:pyruvate kinase
MGSMASIPTSTSMGSFAGMSGALATAQMTKYESIASSAVRAADKINASLILVFTSSGKTAQLVAKYRPPMPIVTLVIPQLVSDGMRWSLMGRSLARQCCLTRGLVPMLATPSTGDQIIKESILNAARMGFAPPNSYVVCLQRSHTDVMLKVRSYVDSIPGGVWRS